MSPAPDAFDERGLPHRYRFKPQWEVAPAPIAARLRDEPTTILLVDCREDDEWAINRLEGAIHVPLGRFVDEADVIADEAEARGATDVVVYCHHGIRSVQGAAMLRSEGIERAWSLAGGIDIWAQSIDPGIPLYTR